MLLFLFPKAVFAFMPIFWQKFTQIILTWLHLDLDNLMAGLQGISTETPSCS